MHLNGQQELEKILAGIDLAHPPRLLLHSCCAPCSSYVLEYLSTYFLITVDYFNPNIAPAEEYRRRADEQARFIADTPRAHSVTFTEGIYDPALFYEAVKGLEAMSEGSERCFACYELRLKQAANAAREGGFDYFGSTLSISPHKNAAKLNEIGFTLAETFGIAWLASDFKKKNGFKRSAQLAEEHGLYRQDYCGCVFSKAERDLR